MRALVPVTLGALAVSASAETIRSVKYNFPENQKSPFVSTYIKWVSEINPFIPLPYSSVKDQLKDRSHNLIYDRTYTTGELGLRTTPKSQNGEKHLIVSGDSNTFGVGCADHETLAARLAQKFSNRSVYNFGLAGTGPSSALRFLELFKVKDFAQENYKEGAFILDYHYYFIQRIIGSKSFLEWGKSAPRYELNDHGAPEYLGPFSESPQRKFYELLDKIPYSKTLFPDLPRIGDRHIELAAQIILKLKNKYLEQTSAKNKFIVIINPDSEKPPGRMERSDEVAPQLKSLVKRL